MHSLLGFFTPTRSPCELPAGLLQVAHHRQLLPTWVRTSAEIYHCFRALFHPTSGCLPCCYTGNFIWPKPCSSNYELTISLFKRGVDLKHQSVSPATQWLSYNMTVLSWPLSYHFHQEISKDSVKVPLSPLYLQVEQSTHEVWSDICGLTAGEWQGWKDKTSIVTLSCSQQPGAPCAGPASCCFQGIQINK